jgi:hypothetical protein
MLAEFLELLSGPCAEIGDGARDEHLSWSG